MSVVGIIAEYNPLHQGHLYHFRQALEETGADFVVCVLSSNFVQRGEPAIFDKWARTRMALAIGAHLVLELPSAFSCASAEYFASAAVRILDSLNCVDFLCFGSEEGKIENLKSAAEFLAYENEEFKSRLKNFLDEGLSFAVARQKALSGCKSVPESVVSVLSKPNNILSVEYIKAIKRMESKIEPVTIKRIGQGYNSLERAASYSSATAVRYHLGLIKSRIGCDSPDPAILEEDGFLVSNLPESSLRIISEEITLGRGPVFPEAFETTLLYLLRKTPVSELKKLPYMEEGLENRLKDAAISSVSLPEVISRVVTNRYPASRIRRILCSLLTGLQGEFLDKLKQNGYAQYIRILGFSEKGRNLLNKIKKNTKLPVITKPAGYIKLQDPLARELFEHEIRATDAYVLALPGKNLRKGGTELQSRPVYSKV